MILNPTFCFQTAVTGGSEEAQWSKAFFIRFSVTRSGASGKAQRNAVMAVPSVLYGISYILFPFS